MCIFCTAEGKAYPCLLSVPPRICLLYKDARMTNYCFVDSCFRRSRLYLYKMIWYLIAYFIFFRKLFFEYLAYSFYSALIPSLFLISYKIFFIKTPVIPAIFSFNVCVRGGIDIVSPYRRIDPCTNDRVHIDMDVSSR